MREIISGLLLFSPPDLQTINGINFSTAVEAEAPSPQALGPSREEDDRVPGVNWGQCLGEKDLPVSSDKMIYRKETNGRESSECVFLFLCAAAALGGKCRSGRK